MWGEGRIVFAITMAVAVFVSHSTISARATEVDLLLALAADVSGSMNDEKFALQREGYSAAITSPRVIEAIQSGQFGRIAICYIEWSGAGNQRVLIDWTVIQDVTSAQRFAVRLAEAPRPFFGHTSIAGGIEFAVSQIKGAPFQAKRQIVDVSGDGDDDNFADDVVLVRERALAAGITINALVVSEDQASGNDFEGYYREKVIGGPGSFIMAAKDYSSFGEAMIKKLVAEIAGLPFTHAAARRRQ